MNHNKQRAGNMFYAVAQEKTLRGLAGFLSMARNIVNALDDRSRQHMPLDTVSLSTRAFTFLLFANIKKFLLELLQQQLTTASY